MSDLRFYLMVIALAHATLPEPPAPVGDVLEADVHTYCYTITGYATAADVRSALELAVEHAHTLTVESVEIVVEEVQ